MNFFDTSFWQSFLSNALATFLGVIIGIPVALWINKLIDIKKESEKKNKILKVLADELTDNLNYLEIWKEERDKKKEIITLTTYLSIESWRAFYAGGELEWIKDITLLNMFAVDYHKIGIIDYLSKEYINLLYSDSKMVDPATLEKIMDKIEGTVESTTYVIQKTLDCIEYIAKKE